MLYATENKYALYIITLFSPFVYRFFQKIVVSFYVTAKKVLHILYRTVNGGVLNMDFDRQALSRLLMLNDAQLKYLVNKFVRDYGIDLSSYNVTEGDIASVRSALSNLSDEQLRDLGNRFRGGKR